tara:strand:+ start:412 stop:660 length:249 start_codon:yes stop_codon:yes gene_type:complete
MDNATKYFVKTLKDKTDKERTKKLNEMNSIFGLTEASENYPGPVSRTLMHRVNDVIRQFRGEDEARAMRHARKAGKIKRSRE